MASHNDDDAILGVGTLFWLVGKAANTQLKPDFGMIWSGADLDPGHGTRILLGQVEAHHGWDKKRFSTSKMRTLLKATE